MIIRKIRDMNKKGNREAGKKYSEKRAIAATILFLTNNPMKRQEVRDKVSMKRKGRIVTPQNLFSVGNKYGTLRKNRAISEEQRLKISMAKAGRPLHPNLIAAVKKNMRENNPMWNPASKAKVIAYLKKKSPLIEWIKKNGHPMKKEEYLKKYSESRRDNVTREIYTEKIIYMYTVEKVGCKIISSRLGISKDMVSRILRENNIPTNPEIANRGRFIGQNERGYEKHEETAIVTAS